MAGTPTVAKVTLHNNALMPILGLGTFRMKTEEELTPVVREALMAGYSLIDSAIIYRNEAVLGKVLNDVFRDPTIPIKRDDVFVTSKLPPQLQGYEKCYQAVHDALERFGLDYFDLFLLHWPGTAKKKLSDPVNRDNRTGSYKALEKLLEEGKVKQIGVSNFTAAHLTDLLANTRVVPHVHQFELHPCLVQQDILDVCRAHQIQVQAYSSLGEGALLDADFVQPIASALGVSPAQVLLRWAVQHGWAVIPKSKTPERVRQNSDLFSFELSSEDMRVLDKVHETNTKRFCWDPSEIA